MGVKYVHVMVLYMQSKQAKSQQVNMERRIIMPRISVKNSTATLIM